MASPVDALKAGVARAQMSEEFSDCTIICGPYHFKAHKLVVGAHSQYFRAAFKADTFKVSQSSWDIDKPLLTRKTEGKISTVELKAVASDSDEEDSCDDPEIVKLMVEYFYHLDHFRDHRIAERKPTVDDQVSPGLAAHPRFKTPARRKRKAKSVTPSPASAQDAPKTRLVEHAKLIPVAVKCQIEALKRLAVQKFRLAVQAHWDHEDLAQAIPIIWTSTPDCTPQLRMLTLKFLQKHMMTLVAEPESEMLLQSVPGLARDLLKWPKCPLEDIYPCRHKVEELTFWGCNNCEGGVLYCWRCYGEKGYCHFCGYKSC